MSIFGVTGLTVNTFFARTLHNLTNTRFLFLENNFSIFLFLSYHPLKSNCLILILLQDVTVFLPEWEDGHFYLAKYYDKLMPMVTDNKMEKQGDLIRYIVHHFGRLEGTFAYFL